MSFLLQILPYNEAYSTFPHNPNTYITDKRSFLDEREHALSFH